MIDALSIVTFVLGLSFCPVGTLTILSTISIPAMTFPNAGCLLSKKLLFTWLMKNWLLPVFGPAFAIDIVPRSLRLVFVNSSFMLGIDAVSYTHLRAHETDSY